MWNDVFIFNALEKLSTATPGKAFQGFLFFMDRVVTIVKWKDIIGWPSYRIANNGLVKKGNLLLRVNEGTRKQGFRLNVSLAKPGAIRRFWVHKLVWKYFSNEPFIKGNHLHHKDLNYKNNHIDNLIQLTPEEHYSLHAKKVPL